MSKSGAFRDTVSRLRLERLLAMTPEQIPGEMPESISGAIAAKDVIDGLGAKPKTLPAKYFYDDYGSQLFEQICALPEYYPTRTEAAILSAYAPQIAEITGACEIVELGSGSSVKTRLLLDAYGDRNLPLHYTPIDISAGILESSAEALIADYPTLEVCGLVGTYELALQRLSLPHLPNRMICFLGSTIGNLNPAEFDLFLSQIFNAMRPGEFFLLGVDLQKSKQILEPAYNDSRGVTAAFNLNILRHLNRKFETDFDLNQFSHHAFYNEQEHQIEMHLRSLIDQEVTLRSPQFGDINQSNNFSFSAGETIQTEISRKFNLDKLTQNLSDRGLVKMHAWTDINEWFGLILCQAQKT